MKRSPFAGVLFAATLALSFAACGGGESKSDTATPESPATDTATASAPAPEVNTIITTPMNMMIVTHKVSDYAKWLTAYEAHDSMRLASGIHNYVIGRGVQDSNTIMVAVKIDDLDKAKAFSTSASLKQAMQKSGVKGAPSVSFATATWQDTAMISTAMRSRTTFSVKDWAAWLKSFEEGQQERIDNGLTVRVVGHDANDDKKVMLVTAIVDSAKAAAYWKSDALKKRREAGGVIGEPNRFLFNIVKRY
jgi:hypothetical protein